MEIWKNMITKKLLEELLINRRLTLKEAEDYIKCSRSTLLKYKHKYDIKIPLSIKVCEFCNKKFKLIIKDNQDKNRKYCSRLCRENAFHHNNPHKRANYQHKSLLKKKRYCKKCNKIIPDELRKNSWTKYCSVDCGKNAKLELSRKIRINAQTLFEEFKENIGCKFCKYSKFGGSLSYHHIDPKTKDSRITSKDFYYKTKIWVDEVPKCILVCDNCHHELHRIMNTNMDYYKHLLNNPDIIQFK